ncbi:MAG: amphi-Trp domain-containing protein [Armatimonadota bacterium]
MAEELDVEEYVDAQRFVQKLRKFADAVESGNDFTVTVQGQDYTVPVGGRMQVEYESDNGGGEFCLEIEW